MTNSNSDFFEIIESYEAVSINVFIWNFHVGGNVVYITINVFIRNFHVGGCLSQNY